MMGPPGGRDAADARHAFFLLQKVIGVAIALHLTVNHHPQSLERLFSGRLQVRGLGLGPGLDFYPLTLRQEFDAVAACVVRQMTASH